MKRTYALLHKNTPEGHKTCLDCGTLKLLENFNVDKTGKFGKSQFVGNVSLKKEN